MTRPPEILELGSHPTVIFAGALFESAQYDVCAWPHMPIRRRQVLLPFQLDTGKRFDDRDAAELLLPLTWQRWSHQSPLIVLDALGPAELDRRGIVPAALTDERELVWMSLPLNAYANPRLASDELGYRLAFHALGYLLRAEYGAYRLSASDLVPTKLTDRALSPIGGSSS